MLNFNWSHSDACMCIHVNVYCDFLLCQLDLCYMKNFNVQISHCFYSSQKRSSSCFSLTLLLFCCDIIYNTHFHMLAASKANTRIRQQVQNKYFNAQFHMLTVIIFQMVNLKVYSFNERCSNCLDQCVVCLYVDKSVQWFCNDFLLTAHCFLEYVEKYLCLNNMFLIK